MDTLKNKVAVITGGSAGIGFATAKELVAKGAKVVITGRDQDKISKSVEELGVNAIGLRADTASLLDTEKLVSEVIKIYGKVDVLFINAGISFSETIGSISEEKFDEMLNVNLKGAVFTTEKFLPILNEGASIVYTTSISSFSVLTGMGVYAATKAGLTAYAKTAAIELASRKIRVNTIAPSVTATEVMYRGEMNNQAIHSFLTSKMPMRRFAEPEEVAKVVSFLVSNEASFISGQEIVVDGASSVNEPFRG